MPFFMMAVGLEWNEDVRDLVQLALLTGARRANLLAMRWDQVGLEDKVWRIPETKNGTPQLLPLTPEATLIFQVRSKRSASPWVFPGSGTCGHMVEPKRGWQRILQRMELLQVLAAVAQSAAWTDDELQRNTAVALVSPAKSIAELRLQVQLHGLAPDPCSPGDLRFHDLRRTLGSWQARTGASLVIIGKSLHHKSSASTAIYARLDMDPVRASIDRAAAAMWTAAGVPSATNVNAGADHQSA
jgi:integrase